MKKAIVVLICLVYALGAIVCGNTFAQRSVNAAQDAARAAKESLTSRSYGSSSRIKWLDQIIDAVNMDETASKGASIQSDKSDTVGQNISSC
jgi:hypothetical protein